MALSSLLALDIGGGTQDLLLWQAGRPLANAVKAVLPSPTQILAARLRGARARGRAVHLAGWLMGGGAVARAVGEHLAAGLAVSATPEAALTFADDLARVTAMGIAIRPDPPAGALTLFTGDLDLPFLLGTLAQAEAGLPARLAVAACDHGFAPGKSNRRFRFSLWEDFLGRGGRLDDLITDHPPRALTRLAALCAQSPGALVMDTAAAALRGALLDPRAGGLARSGVCVLNLGNMHTVAFLVAAGAVQAILEHHTGLLTPAKLRDLVERFLAGELANQEVLDDQGHGVARREGAPRRRDLPVFVTGPRRALAEGLPWPVAIPHGDVMLAGCFGLLAAAWEWAGQAPGS